MQRHSSSSVVQHSLPHRPVQTIRSSVGDSRLGASPDRGFSACLKAKKMQQKKYAVPQNNTEEDAAVPTAVRTEGANEYVRCYYQVRSRYLISYLPPV